MSARCSNNLTCIIAPVAVETAGTFDTDASPYILKDLSTSLHAQSIIIKPPYSEAVSCDTGTIN